MAIVSPTLDPGFAGLVRRRWRTMVVAFAVTAIGGAGALSLVPKLYESQAKLLVMRTEQRTGGIKILDDSLPQLTVNDQPLLTQVELVRSAPVMAAAIRQLGLRDPLGRPLAPDVLERAVQVAPLTGTDLIQVSMQSGDPVMARRIVTAVCDAYLHRLQDLRENGIRDGLHFLDEQLATAHSRLADSEAMLLAFEDRMGGLPLPSEASSSVASLMGLEDTLRTNEIELDSARARASGLRAQLGVSPALVRARLTIGHDREIRGLEDELVKAEADPVLTDGLAAGNPDWQEARARENSLRHRLQARVRALVGRAMPVEPSDDVREAVLTQYAAAKADVQALAASVAATRALRGSIQKQLTGLPLLERDFERLTRNVNVASNVYDELLQRHEEVRANLSVAPTDVQIVQPASLPRRPGQPLKGMGYPVLLVTGLLAAYLAALARDLFTRDVETTDLVAAMPQPTVLARIPLLSRHDRERELAMTEEPRYGEAMRSLALQLENDMDRTRIVAVTSASGGEGKTVTIANLAVCLADLGHRVLVIDADLRRQRQYQVFKLPEPGRGLAEVLLGAAGPMDVARQSTNVDVMTAGTAVAGLKLAQSREILKAAMAKWRESYDIVLVDLPPLAVSSRAAFFTRHVDGLLLLANMRRVTPDQVAVAGIQLKAMRTPIVGLVALTRATRDGSFVYLRDLRHERHPVGA